MQQIFNFLIKYKAGLVFIGLLILGLSLTVKAHDYQNSKIISAANGVTGNLFQMKTNVSDYFRLASQNEVLLQENKNLQEELYQYRQQQLPKIDTSVVFNDTIFKVYTSKVIANNYSHTDNYLLLNSGDKDGLEPGMAVLSSLGVVGITEQVSANFTRVISILNRNISINAKLKKSNHFGTLTWVGEDPYIVNLIDVPRSAKVNVGDTITTGGKSFIFPGEVLIGTVKGFELDLNRGYYDIQIKLFNDMTDLGEIYVVKRKDKEEAMELLENTEQSE
ncbi:MAG: rod shape-determining protein MreC [Psychroflexus sp.]|uniref:rod shape-determining protein MreC n=1 Tax=Psychroflexus sp. S27 TaxID=1982757 RepID=UPI000C2B2875|nr:rod shape-determining protein MreC [Psychroflexus sp. S27]PJX21850.1 rod shape-determining protein MreC [Psychroflexus sp. S27]